MTIERIPTFCRVCEPSCGLIAEKENDVILSLRPDKSHPVTKGFACPKGIYALDMHHDEDRLNHPLKRINNRSDSVGEFEKVSWDACVDEIADRLNNVIKQHGRRAIAIYAGNPLAFNSMITPAMASFAMQLGCSRIFSAGTQDCTNKFAAGEAVFGTSTLHPVPDIENTQYLIIIGENPKISGMSFISISDAMSKLKAAENRGAKIRYINPRKIEAADTTGDVIQIKPDTDVYFFAALLHEIERINGFREDIISAHGKNIEGLRAFIKNYAPERVETVVGIPANVISDIAREFSEAESAAVHASTGINMGRQGTLAYWLVQMLSFVTGNLDKKGGNLYSLGFYPAAKSGRASVDNLFFDSPHGPLRVITGMLPGNLMADIINEEKEPVRALFVLSGNPILSMGGEDRMRKAFEKLDLVVALDIYRNATGEMADFLLPCADMLERPDINQCGNGLQHEPFVQFTEAVVPPRFERKEMWWILARLEKAMGLNSVLDIENYDPYRRINKMLSRADLSIEKLRTLPSQTEVLPKPEPGLFYSDWLQTADKKVDCCPVLFGEPIENAATLFDELEKETEDQLKLITLRNGFMHNTWYHNIEKLKKGEYKSNAVYMNSKDAGKRGLDTGTRVKLFNKWGAVETEVNVDDRLRDGVVAMSHGWGNQKTPGMKIAQKYPGVNVNQLLPTGPGSYEKFSNQAHMTGIPVSVEKIS